MQRWPGISTEPPGAPVLQPPHHRVHLQRGETSGRLEISNCFFKYLKVYLEGLRTTGRIQQNSQRYDGRNMLCDNSGANIDHWEFDT